MTNPNPNAYQDILILNLNPTLHSELLADVLAGKRSIVMSMSVCLCACQRAYLPNYKSIIYQIIIMFMLRGRGSVLFRWCRDKKVAHAERTVPALIRVLGSQPAGDVSHKPGGRLPLLFARPAVIPATLKKAATNFAAW